MLVEVRTFRVAPGVDEAAFVAADAGSQAERSPLTGFVRRTTARGEEAGTWLVLSFWASPDAADAAGPEALLAGLVDATTERVERFVTLD